MEKEVLIKRAKEIYGDKYDFSKVDKITWEDPLTIICPIHGEFPKPLNAFLNQKQGCPKCGKEKRIKNKTYSQEHVIKMARKVHGEKYDYSKFVYTKMDEPSIIICPIHGEFSQTPTKHIISKHGCQKCGIEQRAKAKMLTTEQFIEKAKKVHGDEYIYDKTVYNGTYKPLTVICRIHGEFEQRANDHLNGHGCSKCNQSHLEEQAKRQLTENNIKFEEQKKFEWLGKQSLDFYLHEYNVAIECQGKQHFKPIKMFGGEKEFQIIQERDSRKRKLCEENGIKLLYYSNLHIDYPYKVYEDLNELLNTIKGEQE